MSDHVGDPEAGIQQPLLSTRLSIKPQEPETSHAPWSSVFGRISKMAGPLIISNVFSYALSVIAAIAVGRLNDPTILSAVVLSGSFYNVTGLSLIVGLSAGCDTIAGQAYGAKRYHVVGETLQRAITICLTLCVPVLLLWSRAAPLMLALHQDPDIVAGAAQYLRLVSPSLLMSAISGNINRYLVVQRVVTPGSWCTAITALLCPLYNWLLIYRLDLGLTGAAAAFNASNLTYTLLMVGVVVWHARSMRGQPTQTWTGLSLRAAFTNWPQYLRYGLPAAAMLVCEWWVFELVILMAGSLPDAELAVSVMGIMFHLTCIAFMLPMSVGTACNTCIANELGAGHASTAQAFFRAGLSIVLCIQVVVSSSLYLGGSEVVQLFTSAPEVVSLAEATMPMVALCVVFDGLNSLLSATLRGCGRQAWGAALNLIGYWLLGFPLALLLGFKLNLSTWGFWAALAVASSSQACIQLTFIGRLNWQREVERAAALLAAHEAEDGGVGHEDVRGGALAFIDEEAAAAGGAGAKHGTGTHPAGSANGVQLHHGYHGDEEQQPLLSGGRGSVGGQAADGSEGQAQLRQRPSPFQGADVGTAGPGPASPDGVTSPTSATATAARRRSIDASKRSMDASRIVGSPPTSRTRSGGSWTGELGAEAKRAWLLGSAAEGGRHCCVGAVVAPQQVSQDASSLGQAPAVRLPSTGQAATARVSDGR